MNEQIVLIDGSVNTRSKVGYGAYLVVNDFGISVESLKSDVKVKRFENTSSTKLELETLLWALGEIQRLESKVIVYTDSQNIIGLQGRREHLEQHNYLSRALKRLKNYELYQEFFKKMDQLDCTFVKVRGHMASKYKTEIDQIFTLVDRASREALRKYSQSL